MVTERVIFRTRVDSANDRVACVRRTTRGTFGGEAALISKDRTLLFVTAILTALVFAAGAVPSVFAACPATTYSSGGANPSSVAVGDFNGDGMSDLEVANYSVHVLIGLGNGNGTFAAAVNYATGSNPLSVAVGDFNGDGKSDLALANQGSNN